jgi:hypothetical protein
MTAATDRSNPHCADTAQTRRARPGRPCTAPTCTCVCPDRSRRRAPSAPRRSALSSSRMLQGCPCALSCSSPAVHAFASRATSVHAHAGRHARPARRVPHSSRHSPPRAGPQVTQHNLHLVEAHVQRLAAADEGQALHIGRPRTGDSSSRCGLAGNPPLAYIEADGLHGRVGGRCQFADLHHCTSLWFCIDSGLPMHTSRPRADPTAGA